MAISDKSKFAFIIANITLISVSLASYAIIHSVPDFHVLYFVYISRAYLLMFIITAITAHKKFITDRTPDSFYRLDSHAYVLSTTFFEAVTARVLHNNFIESHIGWSLVYFIPVSFMYEIILDFFHYWAHRGMHMNRTLYLAHKLHHTHTQPTYINTFYFSPIDAILSSPIPTILTVYLLPCKLSLFDFIMLATYKQYTELAGHSGKALAPSSCFPQCIWLPRILGIEGYAEDHDMHHRVSTCNFSKRFSLWDKVFGTHRRSHVS